MMDQSKRIVAEHVLQLFIAATVLMTFAFVLLGPHATAAVG